MNRKLIGQEISNEARKNELNKLKKQLIQYNNEQQTHEKESSEYKKKTYYFDKAKGPYDLY